MLSFRKTVIFKQNFLVAGFKSYKCKPIFDHMDILNKYLLRNKFRKLVFIDPQFCVLAQGKYN